MKTRLTFIFDDEQGGAYERQNILAAQEMRSAYEDFKEELRGNIKYNENQETTWSDVRNLFIACFALATRGFE